MDFDQRKVWHLKLVMECLWCPLDKANAILNLAAAECALANSSIVFRLDGDWPGCMVSIHLGSFHPRLGAF